MQVMRDFLAFKNSGSQDHVASYIAQRIKAANPSMSQTPQDIFNAMGLVGLPGKHGTSYIATPHAGMPTEGVKAGVHLPYEFDADFAKFEQVSTKTMVDIKTAVDASNQASSPVPLTTTLLGMKDPSLTSGITVKGFKVPSYTTGVVNVEVSLQYEKTTFTRTIKLTPSDLPYDFTTDIALMRAATLTSTLSGGDLNSALVATPPPTKVELHLTGEPTFTDGTTVTYTGRGNLSGTTSTVTAILTNGKFTQNVTGIIITTA